MNRYKKYKMRWNILEQYLRSEQNYYSKSYKKEIYDFYKEKILCEILHSMYTLKSFSNEDLKNYIKRYKDGNERMGG